MRLGEVVSFSQGGTPRKRITGHWNGDIPFVTGADLRDFYITKQHARSFLSEEGLRSGETTVCEPGSVLLATRTRVGLASVAKETMGASQDITRITPKPTVQARYLCRVLLQNSVRLQRLSRGTTIQGITRHDAKSLIIPLPPLPEQRAIAAVLDSIDEAIERTEVVIETTEQCRDALRYELLTRGLPGWHSEWKKVRRFGVIPAEWKVVRLGEIAEVVMGQSPPGKTVFAWGGETFDSGLPFVQGNAEFGGKFPQPLKWCVKPARVADSDAFLISVRAPVGQTNRVDQRLAIGRGLAAIRFTGVDRSYGWQAINQAKHALQPMSQGSTFKAIGGKDLRSLILACPPLPEQRRIARVLDSIDNAIEESRRTREALTDAKASTAEALLTGLRRIPMKVEN